MKKIGLFIFCVLMAVIFIGCNNEYKDNKNDPLEVRVFNYIKSGKLKISPPDKNIQLKISIIDFDKNNIVINYQDKEEYNNITYYEFKLNSILANIELEEGGNKIKHTQKIYLLCLLSIDEDLNINLVNKMDKTNTIIYLRDVFFY